MPGNASAPTRANGFAYVRAAERWPTLGHLLRDRARAAPEREALRFEGRSLTLGELEERTNRIAGVLRERGVGRGDRVAVMLPNGFDFPSCWLAVAKAGAVMVPVNTGYRDRDLRHVLTDSGARLLITDPEHLPVVERVRGECPALREVGVIASAPAGESGGAGRAGETPTGVAGRDATFDLGAAEAAAEPSFEIGDVARTDLVSLQYTSGTTGFPKGCMLTHEYWLLLGASPLDFVGLTADDVVLTAQPFYYMDPQWNTVACLVAGCPLVVLPRFSASTFWRSVKEHGVTFFYVLGTMPVYLLKQPPDPAVERGHRVRAVLCSGIVPSLHAAFEERWGCPWREVFGMTESGCDLYVPLDDVASVGTGAVGAPIPTKEARVVDADGRELADGEIGQLVLRGRPMMLGYWNDPEATARTLRDGWLHTGDLVRRDGRGYYRVVGRLKEMVRRTGENIAAAEVEAALMEHPGIRAAAVVPVPDELRGEEVKAFVQLQPGETPESVPPAAIVAFAAERLAKFKLPRFIEYVEDFPRTPSERIAKHELLRGREDQRAGAWDAAAQGRP